MYIPTSYIFIYLYIHIYFVKSSCPRPRASSFLDSIRHSAPQHLLIEQLSEPPVRSHSTGSDQSGAFRSVNDDGLRPAGRRRISNCLNRFAFCLRSDGIRRVCREPRLGNVKSLAVIRAAIRRRSEQIHPLGVVDFCGRAASNYSANYLNAAVVQKRSRLVRVEEHWRLLETAKD